jgi:hypothetical protein
MPSSPETGRIPETEPFHGDAVSPEAFERDRYDVMSAFFDGLLSDIEAAIKLEKLAAQNPTIDTVHNSHANRKVNG